MAKEIRKLAAGLLSLVLALCVTHAPCCSGGQRRDGRCSLRGRGGDLSPLCGVSVLRRRSNSVNNLAASAGW